MDTQVTVITGMRRVGKTTTLKYLMGKVPHSNKLYLDLERLEDRAIFSQNNFSEIQAGPRDKRTKLLFWCCISLR